MEKPIDTLDRTPDESADRARRGQAGGSLVLAFHAESPLAQARSFNLEGATHVAIGRASASGERPAGALQIELQDRFASAPHASLRKIYGRWVIADEESRNGVFLDGAEIERTELRDGAVIEIGRSFFVYRSLGNALPAPETPESGDASWPTTRHAQFAERLRDLAQLAKTPHAVVLRGESGTGKELLAQAIHQRSARSGAFQAINCASLSPSLAEAELFGVRRGAFSGANEDRIGHIRSAEGGTLFLDEIGDLPLPMQGLLLRVLQEREVTPVGATRPVAVDFRLIVATHRDLEAMARAGTFRPDLLARIDGFTLQLPALRDRLEDLGELVASLLRRHAGANASLRFSLAASRALFRYPWPLNIRELEKALSVAIPLAVDGRIDLAQLPASLRNPLPDALPPRALSADDARRKEELIALLREFQGNVSAVAKALGKARMQIHRWMEKYEISPEQFRK